MNIIVSRTVFVVPVDYSRSVKEAVEAGKFDLLRARKDVITTDEYFPPTGMGIVRRNIELFRFQYGESSTDTYTGGEKLIAKIHLALKSIARVPAVFHEILSLGEKFPELQKEFRILGMGSVTSDFNGDYCPFLGSEDSERVFGVYNICDGLQSEWLFAAVPRLRRR